ncbi:MAG: polysaccharide biosynthesis C-terminal domain-containing protein, partial [Propionibacteriaceae bacterium]
TQVDTVLLRFLRNEAEVGFYSVATKVKQALVAVVTALGAVMLPRVTYHAERQEWERFNQLLRTTISVVLMLSLPLALFFGLYAGPTIRILGGARFTPGIAMLQLIIGSLVFIGVTNILGFQLLIPTRRDKIVVYSVVVGAIVDIVLNFALVPQLGGRGTAIATLVAEFAVLLFQLRATRKQSWPAFAAVRWGNLALALAAAAAVSGAVLIAPLPDLVRFIVGAFACFGAYVAVLGWRRDAVLSAVSTLMQRVKGSS